MDTYITLTILSLASLFGAIKFFKIYFSHEKKNFHSYDFPLDNKGKWWYN